MLLNKLDNALPGTSSWAGRVDNSKCADAALTSNCVSTLAVILASCFLGLG